MPQAGGKPTAANAAAASHARHLLEAGPADGGPSGGSAQQQQAVPVILAVAPGSGAVTADAASGAAVDAALANTTQCIRLAAAEHGGGLERDAAMPPVGSMQGGQYERPALDLRGCAAATTLVATGSPTVAVQVSPGMHAALLACGVPLATCMQHRLCCCMAPPLAPVLRRCG